jgi:hypothetical protein
VPELLWVAKLLISDATAKKIDSLHRVTEDDVRDAVVCVAGLRYVWDDAPERGLRVLVDVTIGNRQVLVVLYPVDDAMGDAYALGSAYERT